jgi:hypothetical protein
MKKKIIKIFMYNKMEYYAQYNDPRDLYRAGWNQSQVEQQDRLSGGSWSQPPWAGWKPMVGASKTRGDHWFQRYAQDGDSGFFHGLRGGAEPLGMSPTPPNTLEMPTPPVYAPPAPSEIPVPEAVQLKELNETVPDAEPDQRELELAVNFNAEPQQHANHPPPYSSMLKQGMGKDSVLYEEPFEMPEHKYTGGLHKKNRRK